MKKAQPFKIGDRVGEANSDYEDDYESRRGPLRYDPDGEVYFGVVSDVTAQGKVIVTWDGNDEPTEPMDPKELMLEDKVKTKLAELEVEFNAVEKQIKAKVKE